MDALCGIHHPACQSLGIHTESHSVIETCLNPSSPCSLSRQGPWSVHSRSGGGESLPKGGLVPRGRVHRHDQQHRPHGQDI